LQAGLKDSLLDGDIALENVKRPSYEELFDRNYGVLSETQQESLRKARILIVGCGGIGGTVAIILARAGIENFILVEFDTYDTSNINRQSSCFAASRLWFITSNKIKILNINSIFHVHVAAVAKKISLDAVSDAAERVIRKDPKLLLEILLSGEEVVSC
jgi:tRNA A37 threonylcarbamoyladenosine dehydratase